MIFYKILNIINNIDIYIYIHIHIHNHFHFIILSIFQHKILYFIKYRYLQRNIGVKIKTYYKI
ncbi:hypothetical protein pb186bvf_011836 [Paramecium bursaria]